MKTKTLKVLGAIAVTVLTLVFLITGIKADTLSDGGYEVPVSLRKANSPSSVSLANQYFYGTAKVNVSNGTYAVTVTTNGLNYIKGMTANGQSVKESNQAGNKGDLTFNTDGKSNYVPVAFSLQIPIIGSMNQTAQFFLDYANAKKVSEPAAQPTAPQTPQTPTTDTSTTSTTPTVSEPTTTTTTLPTATTKKKTPAKKPTKKTTVKKTSKTKASTWSYVILQGDNSQKSIANKYYTKKAKVIKSGKKYRVQLTVSYKKSLGLGSHAVKPISVLGKKVYGVKLGQTKKNYTMNYSFYVSSLKQLKKLVKAKIHVKVPMLNISQTFNIRFKFSHSKTAKHVAAAAALPTSNNNGGSGKSYLSNAKLPQTSDSSQFELSALGLFMAMVTVAGGFKFLGGRVNA